MCWVRKIDLHMYSGLTLTITIVTLLARWLFLLILPYFSMSSTGLRFYHPFLSSLYVIIVLIIGLTKFMVRLRLYITIFLDPGGRISGIVFGYVLAFPLTIETMLLATFMAFTVDKHRRHLVDFPASCFCSYDATHLHFFLLFISLLFIIGVMAQTHSNPQAHKKKPKEGHFSHFGWSAT